MKTCISTQFMMSRELELFLQVHINVGGTFANCSCLVKPVIDDFNLNQIDLICFYTSMFALSESSNKQSNPIFFVGYVGCHIVSIQA